MGCRCGRMDGPHDTDVRSVYIIGDVLGSGAFGQVRSCVDKATGQQYAVKIMDKNPPSRGAQRRQSNVDYSQMFRNEVQILQDLDHRNVIRFYQFFEDAQFLYAIIDRCEGGELYQKISGKVKFYESDVARICRQMLESIRYLHSKKIVHRDIKAQNFLFRNHEDSSELVLIDFGMATRLASDEEEYLTRLCGSPHYVSPELVARRYRFSVDIWAVGIVLYLMLYGKYPFEGRDRASIMKKVASAPVHFADGPSALPLDLLKSLLNKDASSRITASQALNHPWLSMNRYGTMADAEVPSDVVRAFERKMTAERNDSVGKHFERKLSKMDEIYRKTANSPSRRLSSAGSANFDRPGPPDNTGGASARRESLSSSAGERPTSREHHTTALPSAVVNEAQHQVAKPSVSSCSSQQFEKNENTNYNHTQRQQREGGDNHHESRRRKNRPIGN